MIEHLKNLSPEDVELFLSTRNPAPLGINPKLAEYILQINEAAILLKEHKYITECAEKLKESYPNLSLSTCKNRIYDAIKYFNSGSNVTAPEWNSYFADRMMELHQKNFEAEDYKEARLCMEKALEYYLSASANAIDPERKKFRHQIVSQEIELSRMGVKKSGILTAWRQSIAIIEKMDMGDTDKSRLMEEVKMELNISDMDYEESKP